MIKLLTIGNSFSDDCDEWLPAIAASAGISLTLGNLYIGGCSLENHWKHVESGEKDYIYYKWEAKAGENEPPAKHTREGSDILSAVLDEDWDMVTFQQVSVFSGKTETFHPWIERLKGWVKDKIKNPDLKIGLHMTWSYGEDSDHPDFIRYGKDSLRMYFAIENAYKIISKDIGADFVIPSGRVVQAARREPVLAGIGRDLTRDGFHLDLGSGRYLAGLAGLLGITGMKEDVLDKVGWYPEELMTKEQKDACIACAKRALKGFPDDFAWGAATASYQVEGAAFEGGKGEQIWDVFCKTPGKVNEGQSGAAACDSYHRFREDVALMKEIGLTSYRFSLSWARLLPEGCGQVNQEGVDYYNALIDALLEQGIKPYITLFHWDYPYALYQKGGWMNPDSVDWFAQYAALAVSLFSDRVTEFITFNEPQCFVGLGHVTGEQAPGLKNPPSDTFLMAHHVMMAHGKAVLAMRAAARQPIHIGYAPTGTMCYPRRAVKEDIEAARRMLFSPNPELDRWSWTVAWWSDPVMLGSYPEESLIRYEPYLPPIRQDDLKLMHQPIDFYGQNIYNGWEIQAGEDGEPQVVRRYDGFPRTGSYWPVTPQCLYWGPKFLYERYKKPIYITENGISCHDVIAADERVHDPDRQDFVGRYLYWLKMAAADGVDIRGYFQWSLMDNFEWTKGYSERFGMIYVDYRTQERILKDSAYWYKKTIQTNGENLPF